MNSLQNGTGFDLGEVLVAFFEAPVTLASIAASCVIIRQDL